MSDDKQPKVKVHILKPCGPYLPGQEVEVEEATAMHLCDGVKAMRADDFGKLQAAKKDPKNLTVMEMNELGIKNIPQDLKTLAATEKAALEGQPYASGEPITVTGGVTPPTLVFPAMAEAGKHPVSDVSELKKAFLAKKEDDKKADKKAEPVKPVAPAQPVAPAHVEEKK